MKNRFLIIVTSWLMVALSMLIIFNFSSQNAETSSKTSGGVIKDILEVVMPKDEITEETITKFQPPIRKMAHFSVFMLLGFCLINAFQKSFNFSLILKNILSLIVVILYACLDEYHQCFVSERGPSFKDVLIDSAGGIFGIVLFALMLLAIKFLKLNKNSLRAEK